MSFHKFSFRLSILTSEIIKVCIVFSLLLSLLRRLEPHVHLLIVPTVHGLKRLLRVVLLPDIHLESGLYFPLPMLASFAQNLDCETESYDNQPDEHVE